MGTLGCAKEETEYTIGLGNRLKSLRAGKGISQKNMAELLGISRTYLSNIERGVNRLTVFLLEKYCNIFKMSPDEILQYNLKEEGLSHAFIMELERMNEPIFIVYTLGALQLHASGAFDKDGSVSLIGKDIPSSVTAIFVDTKIGGWQKFRDHMVEEAFRPGDLVLLKDDAKEMCLDLVASDINNAVLIECIDEGRTISPIPQVRFNKP